MKDNIDINRTSAIFVEHKIL